MGVDGIDWELCNKWSRRYRKEQRWWKWDENRGKNRMAMCFKMENPEEN